jgi:divalent metal cation (Fe/Co/Zn/Cd) transporter
MADSAPLAAEASMTFLDGWLATGILIALALNALAGLWWADPAAGILVALFCAREAAENWKEARGESGTTNDDAGKRRFEPPPVQSA